MLHRHLFWKIGHKPTLGGSQIFRVVKVLKIPKLTKDRVLKRLRWFMVCVILVDTVNTLLGQPPGYAENPEAAQEFNKFMKIFVGWGAWPFVATSLLYVIGWFLLVSVLPRKVAYASMFAVVLGHYFGASTWMVYHWGFGVQASVIYGAVIALGFVWCGLPQPLKMIETEADQNE